MPAKETPIAICHGIRWERRSFARHDRLFEQWKIRTARIACGLAAIPKGARLLELGRIGRGAVCQKSETCGDTFGGCKPDLAVCGKIAQHNKLSKASPCVTALS